jgi:hypothetical protein
MMEGTVPVRLCLPSFFDDDENLLWAYCIGGAK